VSIVNWWTFWLKKHTDRHEVNFTQNLVKIGNEKKIAISFSHHDIGFQQPSGTVPSLFLNGIQEIGDLSLFWFCRVRKKYRQNLL
jgi:hypothetical protein